MIRTRSRRVVALALLVSSVSGCYRYVGAEIVPVARGETVRVHVTQAGTTELRALSADAQPVVAGVVMSWADDEVMLRVPDRRGPTVVMGEAIGQDVRIPTHEIVQLERRRVDAVRTGLASALTVAVVGAAVVTILSDAFGGDDLSPPGEDNQLRVPLFSVRVP